MVTSKGRPAPECGADYDGTESGDDSGDCNCNLGHGEAPPLLTLLVLVALLRRRQR